MKRIIALIILLLLSKGARAQTIAELDSITEHLEQIGYFYEALDLLDKSDKLTHDLKRRQATLLYAIGEYQTSVELLKDIVARDTTFVIKDYILLANNYTALQKTDSALLCRTTIAQEYPYNESNLVILAQLARNAGIGKNYLSLLNVFLEKHPNSKPIRRELAHTLYSMEEYSEAQGEFQALYTTGDKNINTLYYLGNLLLRENNLISSSKALKVLEEAVVISDGGTPLILIELATAKTRMRKLDEAMELLDQADSLTFHSEEVLYLSSQLAERRAQVYLERQQWKTAIEYLKKAHTIDPTNRRMLYMLARTYQRVNDIDNEEYYLKALLKNTYTNGVSDSEWVTYAKARLIAIKEQRFMEVQ